MKSLVTLFFVLMIALSAGAQKPDDVLATATGHTFKVSDLSAEVQKDIANLPTALPRARAAMFDQLVNQKVVTAEAKARGLNWGKLIADEKAKIANPTEAEIKKVFDDNQAQIGSATLEQVRPRIVAYLRGQP